MKMWVLLLALAVFTNSQRPLPIFEKIEMQSASDTIVTELLETTFCVPTKLAKEIGHIFRNVPLNLVKEMAAFIVKVFGDSSLNHLDSFSQNTVQAAHIFRQVLEHIDVNKVVAILLPIWTKIIVKFDTLRLLVQDAFVNNFGFGGTNNQLTRRQGCPPGCYYLTPGIPCIQGICPDGCCEML